MLAGPITTSGMLPVTSFRSKRRSRASTTTRMSGVASETLHHRPDEAEEKPVEAGDHDRDEPRSPGSRVEQSQARWQRSWLNVCCFTAALSRLLL